MRSPTALAWNYTSCPANAGTRTAKRSASSRTYSTGATLQRSPGLGRVSSWWVDSDRSWLRGRENMLMELSEALDLVSQVHGSDLLISAYTPARLRRDGELQLLDERPLTPEDTELMLRSVLTIDQWRELEQRRHVDSAFTWREAARIRAHAYA